MVELRLLAFDEYRVVFYRRRQNASTEAPRPKPETPSEAANADIF